MHVNRVRYYIQLMMAGYNGGAGNWVVIDHGDGYVSKYMHHQTGSTLVKPGDKVEKGQQIASVGSTGASGGPHCHFQIEKDGVKIDPLQFKYNNGMGQGSGGFGTGSSSSSSKDSKGTSDSESSSDDNNDKETDENTNNSFTTYSLNDNQVKAIAKLCNQEQGTVEGAAAEASLMANRYELYGGGKEGDAGQLYQYIRTSGWWANAANFMDNGNADEKVISAVKSVLVDGKRVLPKYVDEHDCISDISSATNDGKSINLDNRSEYVSNKTIIKNSYGSTYTFYSFPAHASDPFGTTLSESKRNELGDFCYASDGSAQGQPSTNSKATKCYAKVATWSQEDTTITTNDPDVEESSNTIYTMETTKINYQELVDKYTMPFDFLWALLVVGESKDFVMELADLAYNSDIQITVHDNYKKNTDIDEWNYTKEDRVKGSGTVEDTNYKNTETVQPFEQIDDYDYTTTKTVVTQTNTLQVDLTKADTWIVEYNRESKHEDKETNTSNDTQTKDDTNWKETSEQPDPNTYSHANITSAENNLKAKAKQQSNENKKDAEDDSEMQTENNDKDPYDGSVNIVRHLSLKKDSHYVKIQDNITNTVESISYKEGTPEVKEKTDSQENVAEDKVKPNFVTIFRKPKYSNNKSNIMSAASWLFEILETNKSTSDMVDLVKYLLYKATGVSYGVKEYDFSIYDASKFKSVTEETSEGDSGGVVEMLKSYENESLREYMNNENIAYSNVSEYVTKDRKQYKLYKTEFDGCLNFSYGVMVRNADEEINNESYFKDEGVDLKSLLNQYDAGKEVLVDADIVDRIKDKIVSDKKSKIRKEIATHGVEMKENQIDALIMVSYQYGNCGEKLSGSQNIAEVYKNYYQKGNTEGFKNNAICQTESGGLANFFVTGNYPSREKYTWKLFNEGIYTLSNGKVITSSSSGGKSNILQSAKKIHTYMEQHGYYYSTSGGVLKSTFEESKNSKGVCCATYVMWVLKDCGLIKETSHSADGLAAILQNTYKWKKVDRTKLQAGDVIYYPGQHIEIYAGNGEIYNAGADSAISRANPYKSNWYLNNESYGLRAP